MESVVGDDARPDEFPESGLRIAGEAAAGGVMERAKNDAPYFAEHFGDALRVLGELRGGLGRRREAGSAGHSVR